MAGESASAGVSTPTRLCQDCDGAVAGRSLRCDACKARRNCERATKWNRENRERFLARQREYYAADPEKAKARVKAAMEANPDRVTAQRAKQKAAETPEQRRNYYLRHKYGITLGDERAMLAAQGGCAICQRTELPAGQRWHVDHDHLTGAVRGILCRACNLLLGHARDDSDVLARAIAYLEQASIEKTA